MVGLAVAAISVGQLVTVTEPRTTAAICAQVAYVGDGAGGIPTVWAVQRGGSRTLKLPLAEVRPGCSSGAASPVGAPATDPTPPAARPARPAATQPPAPVPVSTQPQQ